MRMDGPREMLAHILDTGPGHPGREFYGPGTWGLVSGMDAVGSAWTQEVFTSWEGHSPFDVQDPGQGRLV